MAINFPDAPVPGQIFQSYVWDGEKWLGAGTAGAASVVGAVRYDAAQALTAAQMSQGRANIAVTKKNYIINGGMQVSQENGNTFGNIVGYYPADQWITYYNGASTVYGERLASTSPSGSPNRLSITVAPADTSIAASDYYFCFTRLEGSRIADLMWGTPNAKTVTLQFGWKSPVVGTFSVVVGNTVDSSYLANFTITAGQINQDTIQTIVIPGITSGTWRTDNGVGMHIQFTIASGRVGVAGLQSSPTVDAAPGITNNTNPQSAFHLFDVSLTEGSVAPPFQLPDYATELELCQRYYNKITGNSIANYSTAGTNAFVPINYPMMRGTPTVTFGTPTYGNASALGTFSVGLNGLTLVYTISTTAVGSVTIPNINLAARL